MRSVVRTAFSLFCFSAALLWLSGGALQADFIEYTWTGATDSAWSTTTNWSGGSVAPYGGTSASRLSVNCASGNPVIYGSDQGYTVYNGSDRSLLIFAGEMDITGGTFESQPGNVAGDGMATGSTPAKLVIDGGAYINTSGSNNQFQFGYASNHNVTLDLKSGSFTVNKFMYGRGSGTNGGTGTVNLDGGTLCTGEVIDVGTGTSSNFNFNGGTLQARDSNTTFLQGLNYAYIKSGGAKIDTNTYTVTIGQNLLAGGSDTGLTKLGTGTLTLSGSNTYIGATAVSAGTLKISGSGNINTTSGVIVDGADAALLISGSTALTQGVTVTKGTLGGTGTISGPISLTADSILAPGESIGTLTVGSALTLAGTTHMEIDKNPTVSADRLDLGGNALTFGGVLQVVGSNVGNYLAGDSFNLFDATSFAGGFSSVALPTLGAGLQWDTSYLGSDGTLRIGAVPEPGALAILLTGLLGLLAYAWRRRK